MRHLIPLLGMVLLVWSSLLLGTFFISRVILGIHGGSAIATGIMRVGLGGLFAALWLYVWKRLAEAYFWRALRRRSTEPVASEKPPDRFRAAISVRPYDFHDDLHRVH